MEKVYVIHVDDVDDCSTLSHDVEVFRTKKDATNRLETIVADFKEIMKGFHETWKESKEEDYYEAWPDGFWGTDHYGVYLTEVDLK